MRSALLLAAALVASISIGQVTRSGELYTLRMKLNPGTNYSYAMRTDADGSALAEPIVLATGFKMAIGAGKDGWHSVGVISDDPSVGRETISMNNRGQVKGGKNPLSQMSAYPKAAVKAGDSWSASLPVDTALGRMTVNATYTFRGMTKFEGKSLAVLDMSFTAAGQGVSLAGQGRTHIDPQDGMLSSAEIYQSVSGPSSGSGGQVNIHIRVWRR